MAWPTPASTTNLDAGSDNPGLARADIKQNVDNTNSIISEFGTVTISSPQDAEALVYNGSAWVNSGAGGTRAAYLSWSPTSWYIQNDQYSLVNSISGNNLNLAAGNYLIILQGLITAYHSSDTPGISNLDLQNGTASTKIADIRYVQMFPSNVSTGPTAQLSPNSINSAHEFTLSATSDVQILLTATSQATTGDLSAILYRI